MSLQVLKQQEHKINTTTVSVYRALRPADVKIYVGDLPPYVKNKELTLYFEYVSLVMGERGFKSTSMYRQFGNVTDIIWPEHRDARRNFCFVLMSTEEEAERASKKTKVIFGDRECTVLHRCCDRDMLFEFDKHEIWTDRYLE